jgi:hypothetical protein
MKICITLLIVVLLSGPAAAVDSSAPTYAAPIATAASREVARLVRSSAPALRLVQPQNAQTASRGWIARHPRLFGALVGFGAGCAIGAAKVGGSSDTFFNTLDELACPVVGGIGATAGLIVGMLSK